VPNNELPYDLRGEIPANEVWVREDIFRNKKKFDQLLWHETEELKFMTANDLTYKDAHTLTTSKEIQKFGSAGKTYRTRQQSENEYMERRDLAQQIEEEQEFRQYPQKQMTTDWKLEKEIREKKQQEQRQKRWQEEQFWANVGTSILPIKKTDKKLELEDFL
jgi:hypothetical protein